MVIKRKFVFSFLFLSLGLASQDKPINIDKPLHQIYFGTEILGVTALPLSAVLLKDEINRSRIMGKIQYIRKDWIGCEIALGIDRRQHKSIRDNLTQYELKSEYVQFLFQLLPIEINSVKIMFGIGASTGRIFETGIVSIGGDYFDPFQERLIIDDNFVGWIFAEQIDIKINDKWHVETNIRVQSVKLENPGPTQVLQSVPGGGRSFINDRYVAFDVNALITLKYRIYHR